MVCVWGGGVVVGGGGGGVVVVVDGGSGVGCFLYACGSVCSCVFACACHNRWSRILEQQPSSTIARQNSTTAHGHTSVARECFVLDMYTPVL